MPPDAKEIKDAAVRPDVDPNLERDIAEALKGLDALDTPTVVVKPWWRRALAVGLPPLVALVLFIAVWQLIWASAITSEYKVPSPISVWDEFATTVDDGRVWSILWTSISRAFVGFAIALVIATPLGLLVAKVRPVRAAIGPILSGLQSLPSVAWVPAAILWFGLTDATIYFVVLAGSIPMPTTRMRKIAAITPGMFERSLPSLRYAPRP